MAIPLGHGRTEKLWVVVGVTGHARFTGAWMVPTRTAHDVLAGMLRVLGQFGAVPRRAVWEGCIGEWRQGRQRLTGEFQAFRGTLGMGAVLCAPADPEAKGPGGAGQRLLRDELPARAALRRHGRLQPPAHGWLVRANNRVHGTTGRRPAEALLEDRGAMMAFPLAPPDPSWRFSTRLPRDHYVRVDTNDYSVNPRFVGRRIEVRVTLDEVAVACEGVEVARHPRCLARHRSLLAPEHARTLRAMRAEATVAAAPVADVEERDLAVYDRITGAA